MRRRLLLLLLALVAGIVIICVTLPLWLGQAVKWAGPSRGLTFGSYERIGYARFVLRDAEFKRKNVRVTVSRAEGDTPLLWLWRHWRDQPSRIVASNWQVEVTRSTTPRDPNKARGWVPLRAQLQRIATQLDRWLPHAEVGAGVVRWPGGELSIASARWLQRELATKDLVFRALKADATLAFDRDLMRLVAANEQGRAKLESRGDRVSGNVTWWDQPVEVVGRFAAEGWLPAEASLEAKSWRLPGARLKVGEHYTAVSGATRIEWKDGRFVADITAASEPLRDKKAPPLEVAVRGQGDLQAFTLESLQATLPGLTATLSEPVTIERGGRIRESATRFTLQADLARMPWLAASGTVTGEARLVSGLATSPIVEFSAEARSLRARDVSVSQANARGRLAWPRLELAEGTLVGGAGERLAVRGGWDFRAKELLATTVEGTIRRASVARWLPAQPGFESVQVSATASGPLANVAHHGNVRAENVKLGTLKPIAVATEWRGTGARLENFAADATAGASRIRASGTTDATAARLNTLEFTQNGTTRLALIEPTTLRWRPQLQIDRLRLTGPEGNLTAVVGLGEKGRLELSAGKISSRWFDDFVATKGPPWSLSLLALIGSWDRGPMTFSLTAGAGLEIGEGRTASVNLAAKGGADGVRIEALRANEADATVINATGRLPLTFTPTAAPLVRIDPNGALVLDGSVAPNSAFWQKLAAATGVELKEPRASVQLAGTWRQPEGRATVQAARIAIDPKLVARPLPTIEALDLQVTGDPAGVTLSRFTLSVEGQAVRAQGRLPVRDGRWDELFKNPVATARSGADLRIEVPDADVAVFARFLPAVLAPKGRLQADVQYKNGGLEGFLRLRDAASRPLGPLGVLQEINAEIALSGRSLALRGVTARSGGQPVTLSGTMELPTSGMPRFDLALQGENLPFVRQTGVLLRGDLDLKLQTPAVGPPRLSGQVRLRDSLFLADVRAFLPKGGASAARRPPYFAIETPPVNAWGLAVDVSGEQFLRLRTPVFTGVASARFRLGGTLGEPRAIGEITIDEGSVRMPFASFAVAEGAVRLTEADPYEAAIYLRASGRRWNYDLTMEVDGSASQPNIVFTSSPALDSEQVLLMVMTGAAPRNEVSRSATDRMASVGWYLGQSLYASLGHDTGDADRLSVATGEKISPQGEETYEVEYKVTDRWSVVAERNEFEEVNAGVKWRIFREKRPEGNGDHAKR